MSSSASAQDNAAAADDAVGTPKDIGYFLGFSIGQQLSNQGFEFSDFNMEGMGAGMKDALAGESPALTNAQIGAIQGKIQAILQKRQTAKAAEMEKQAAVNLEKSQVWMKQNSAAKGVQQLDGGVQYKVIKKGDGGSPSLADTVKVHYTGKLTDGTVFDSSVERGEPASFGVGQVIKGWQQALQEMKVGSKWMLYIPPELAYGQNGSPPRIGPNEVLVFEVELLDIL